MALNPEQVDKAVKALFAFTAKQQEERPQSLFDDDDYVSLLFGLKKTPEIQKKATMKHIQIPLPHSLYTQTGDSVCVITKDPQTAWQDSILEPGSGDADAEEATRGVAFVGNVDTVISVTKLRKNYKTYEDRRKLLGAHVLFLADEAVTHLLPPLLGVKFFEKKKHPVALRFPETGGGAEGGAKLQAVLKRARDSTYVLLASGPCFSVKIARLSFSHQQVCENILQAVPLIVKHIPSKWTNLQAVHLKSSSSVALPLFNSLPSQGLDLSSSLCPPPALGLTPVPVSVPGKRGAGKRVGGSGSAAAGVAVPPAADPTNKRRRLAAKNAQNAQNGDTQKGREKKVGDRGSKKKEEKVSTEVVITPEAPSPSADSPAPAVGGLKTKPSGKKKGKLDAPGKPENTGGDKGGKAKPPHAQSPKKQLKQQANNPGTKSKKRK